MKEHEIEIFGYIGTFFVISINIPLCIKVYRSKSTNDLSMTTFILTLLAGIFYLIYGIFINKIPLILCNVVICIITSFLIYFKIIYDKKSIITQPINLKISSI